jgi:7,8-dihydropterin-6-yl-methyl-4-(beta-D-ribofuranosyl)aminobenzene 5'-phosphate synthase
MLSHLSITILVDNLSGDPGLRTEHGFALWIEADERRILFDTGQSGILLGNAERLGIDLSTVDALVISHGHYDHTGGITAILEQNPALPVYCHPAVFTPRYSTSQGRPRPIGIGKKNADALHRAIYTLHWVNAPLSLGGDIGITGPVPRTTSFEDTGGAFSLDPEAGRPDPIEDDLSLWLRTPRGQWVVTGCCHAGLVNTLLQVQTLTGEQPVTAIIGGFHLLHASSERLAKTAGHLQSMAIERLVPCHCTGESAVAYLQERFGERVTQGGAGLRFSSGV